MMPDLPFDEATKSISPVVITFTTNFNYFSIENKASSKKENKENDIMMPDLPFDEAIKERNEK